MSFPQLDLWNDQIDDEWLSFEEAKAIVLPLIELDWLAMTIPGKLNRNYIPCDAYENEEIYPNGISWYDWSIFKLVIHAKSRTYNWSVSV